MIKLMWHAEKRPVKNLKNWSKNPRRISKHSFAKLKERIEQRGFHDVIKIDTDNTVLSGNMRKKALTELAIEEVTVLVPNRPLTEEEKNKVALESNINDGEWDFSELRSFDIGTISDLNFDDSVLKNLWTENLETQDDGFDADAEIKKIREPKTKPGDLLLLGPHKLICGNSGDPAVLQRLFGSEKASMIYSDPPYNLRGGVDYEKGFSGKRNYGAAVQDNRSDEEYAEFLRRSLKAALGVVKDDCHVFYWSDQTYIGLVQQLYRELGITNKRVCLWIKNAQNPTPGVAFSKCYEPCTYGLRGTPYVAKNIQNLNEVLNKEITTGNNLITEALDHLDLWMVKRLSGKEYEHATSKPPKLHEKSIRRCTKPGDIILDSFGGSASTMIAAEQLQRRAYMVELEPAFCDLAALRYKRLTGISIKFIHSTI